MNLSELFSAVVEALPARRGSLQEQYLERELADGTTRRNGPYYVWTRCEGGKMVSERVAREDVKRVQEELARGKQLDGLFGQLWKLAEEMARSAGAQKKRHRTD